MSDNSTTTSVSSPTVTELKARFESLVQRGNELGQSLQALVPVNERSQEAQQAFLLAFADFQSVQNFFENAREAMNGIVIVYSTKEEIEAAGGIVEDLAELAKGIMEQVIEQLGVSEEAVKATMITSFVQVLDLIDATTTRAEAQLAIASK